MDKQIIKNIIIEKQLAIPNYRLTHRDFVFGKQSNYILVGLRRAGKSYLLYQDIQDRIEGGEISESISWVSWLCHHPRLSNRDRSGRTDHRSGADMEMVAEVIRRASKGM